MTVECRPHCLAIVDANRLRQAGIASLLEEWARSHALETAEVSPENVLSAFDGSRSWRLIIISVGSEPLDTAALQMLFRIFRAFAADTPTVILSDSTDPVDIVSAYRAECRGFLPTNMQPEVALQALEFIIKGGTYFPPSALSLIRHEASEGSDGGGKPPDVPRKQKLMVDTSTEFSGVEREDVVVQPDSAVCQGAPEDRSCPPEVECSPLVPGLTFRQHQVLVCLHKGKPNKVIARELGVTEGTVKVHVRQIMRRLGAANRTQAAVFCERDQAVETDFGIAELGTPNGKGHESPESSLGRRHRVA